MASNTIPEPPAATILIVDDEPALLALVRTMLWRAGYKVLEAPGGQEALRVVAEHDKRINLLLTDILMPDMNGFELAEELHSKSPEVKVLYMSGYTDTALVESTGRRVGGAPLIRKPFTAFKLVSKIAEMLQDPAINS